jgi:hypothetical protein
LSSTNKIIDLINDLEDIEELIQESTLPTKKDFLVMLEDEDLPDLSRFTNSIPTCYFYVPRESDSDYYPPSQNVEYTPTIFSTNNPNLKSTLSLFLTTKSENDFSSTTLIKPKTPPPIFSKVKTKPSCEHNSTTFFDYVYHMPPLNFDYWFIPPDQYIKDLVLYTTRVVLYGREMEEFMF